MQQIERYGVIALVFLLVTIVAVSFWGDSKSPGFWARLTGKAKKQDVAQVDPQTSAALATPPATTSEQALQTNLALNQTPAPAGDVAFSNAPAPIVATPIGATPIGAPVPGADPFGGGANTMPPAGTLATPVAQPLATGSQPGGVVALPMQPEAAPVQPIVVEPVAHEYVVQKGDSLARIARRTLGREDRWTEIQALNGGVSPSALKVGMKLKLPAGASADASSSLAVATKPAAKSSTPAKSSAPKASTPKQATKATTSTDSGAFYTVKKGDTLNAIAERRLGAKGRVREILALNPGLDPTRISVGTKIKLPAGEKPVLVAANVSSSSERPHVR